MCVCFPQMPLHSSVKYTGRKLILTLGGEGSLGQYHIVKTTNLKLVIYVGHSSPHRSPIWGKFMSKLGKGSQGLPRKHLGGRREVTAFLLLDRESHLGDCDEEPLLDTCTLIMDSTAKLYSWEVTCQKHFECKKDKELIWIYPLKGHKEKLQLRNGESSYKDSLRRFTFVPCWDCYRQQTPDCTVCLVRNQPINVHTAHRDAQGCRSLGQLPGGLSTLHLWDASMPVNPRRISSLLPKDNRTRKGAHK